MGHSCLICNKKVSPINLKNFQCCICSRYCHPKCARYCPPICLKMSGNYRFKIVRNKKWKCESCVLSELPFFDLSDSQIIELVPKKGVKNDLSLPSCHQLNDLFVIESNDDESNNNELNCDLSDKTNDTIYTYSSDVNALNFCEEVHKFDSLPVVSINIRSLVNRDNFTKFEGFLDTLSVKPLVIALNET